jgi:signal transduction histidine kinase/CheY-like chemotaxis protein
MGERENSDNTTMELPKIGQMAPTDEYLVVSDLLQLVVVAGPGAGRFYPVEGDVTIGRDPDCEVWIPDQFASRRHAQITRSKSGGLIVKDLGSRNGTRLNGAAITRECSIKTGDMIGVANTVMLLTSEVPTDLQFQQMQKMEALGRLAGGVAHDFNNLLTAVVNNAQFFLDNEQLAPAEVQACASEILVAAERGAMLSRQLLDFARVESTTYRPVNLTDLLNELVEFCSKTFRKSIEVRAQIPGGLMVRGDKTQLFQAIMNVLMNSEDALPRGGKVELKAVVHEASMTAAMVKGFVEISVADNGVGMTEATVRRIYEPFFSSKPKGKGTGLGLSITFGIIQRHGGQISVRSTLDKGTTFKITMPLAEHKAEVAERQVEQRSKSRETAAVGARVLLIDDDDLVRNSTARLLRSIGFDVLTASDGAEGIAAYEKTPVPVVLLDMVMPTLGGKEAFHILRRLNPEVKIIAISGFSEPGLKEELVKKGAVAFLSKPIEISVLRQTIEKALGPARSTAP